MRLIRCTNVCFVISAYTSLQVYKHNRVYRDNVDKPIYYSHNVCWVFYSKWSLSALSSADCNCHTKSISDLL